MSEYQCQNCGETAIAGHNCEGKVFISAPPLDAIEATGARLEMLNRKGFHRESHIYGPYYRHPMYGIIAIYPGGIFKTAYTETKLGLDAYLESLSDSSYTDIGPNPYEARCDSCKAVGPLFPSEDFPFHHQPDCPQSKR
jgi:hypothetical protein